MQVDEEEPLANVVVSRIYKEKYMDPKPVTPVAKDVATGSPKSAGRSRARSIFGRKKAPAVT